MRVVRVPWLRAVDRLGGEQSDREHRQKFTAIELEVLVEEANKHIKSDPSRKKKKFPLPSFTVCLLLRSSLHNAAAISTSLSIVL